MSGMAVLGGMMALGGVFSAYGSIKASQAQADQMRRQARIQRLVAEETIERAHIEQRLTMARRQKDLGDISSSFAASNIDVTTGAPMDVMREFLRLSNEEIALANREAQFQAKMQRMGAQDMDLAAMDTLRAGRIQALSSILGGSASAASVFRGYQGSTATGARKSSGVSRSPAIEG